MAVAGVSGSTKSTNGYAYTNGNGNGNSKTVSRRRTEARLKKQGLFAWLLSAAVRYAIWASVFVIIFRCPSSPDLCDDTSPVLCKPYFQARDAVLPHVQPYYDEYAAPYVDVAKPYYDIADARVFTPARAYSTKAISYAYPYAQVAQRQVLSQWDKTAQPHIDKVQQQVRTQYDQTVAPHVARAFEVSSPYLALAQTKAGQTYDQYLVPGYDFVQPYALQGYETASTFAANTALPAAHWALNKAYLFVDTAIWPQIRVLYLENVEPQLVRIGERLGRHKTKVNGSLEELDKVANSSTASTSFQKPSAATTSSAASKATETQVEDKKQAVPEPDESDRAWHPVQAPPATEGESETRRLAREMVAEDLEMWQTKFATKADEGASDMEDRVHEIAERMIHTEADTKGKALVQELQTTIDAELGALRSAIAGAAETATEENAEDVEAQIVASVRKAGGAIKKKAQAIRTWREKYDANLQATVVKAADAHFQILDETRNLAFQKIGMKWAWTDGVSYKDWAKYHELKSTLTEWTEQLKQLIVTHPSLLEAQEASAQLEDEGMEYASGAAKELARLKEVAHYKIVAADASDNFQMEAMKLAATAAEESRQMAKAAAEKAKQAEAKAAEQARQAKQAAQEEAERLAAAAKEAVEEPLEQVSSVASDVYNSGKEYVESAASSVADVVEDVTSSASDLPSQAAEAVDEQSTAASQSASSVLAEGEAATSEAQEELLAASDGASSVVSESVESVVSHASEATDKGKETIAAVVNDAASEAESVYSQVSDSASPVFSSASSGASEAASSATSVNGQGDDAQTIDLASQASEAIIGSTDNIVANASDDSSAKDAEPEADEFAADEAEVESEPEKDETPPRVETPQVKPVFLGAAAQEVPQRQVVLDDYVDTDLIASATDKAASAYADAVARAAEQYSSAVSVVSAQIYGTPKPVHNQLLEQVSAAYENAVAAASSRFNDAASAVTATATQKAEPTYVDWAKVESIAAQRLNEGRLWAELQYSSAIIAMGLATPTPTATAATDRFYSAAKQNYYAGLGLAQERYSSFLAAAGSAMSSMTATPTPTDVYGSASSIFSIAKESAASVTQAAEEAVGSAYEAVSDGIANAAGAADAYIGSVADGVSEQVYLAGVAIAETWDNVVAQIGAEVYGETEKQQIGWYDSLFSEMSSASGAIADRANSISDQASESAEKASTEARQQYEAVSQLVGELLHGREQTFQESVLSRLSEAYATASVQLGNVVGSAGEKASQATEAVKEATKRDEL